MKKIIPIFILLFSIIGGVYSSGWLAGKGKNWIAKPDNKVRFGDIEAIYGIDAYKDNFTGLYWEVNPSVKDFNYNQAVEHCNSKGNGWKLPDIKELQTIITYKEKNLNNAYTLHPNVKNLIYWSSTFHEIENKNFAFYVAFRYGNVYYNNVNNSAYVICVHD